MATILDEERKKTQVQAPTPAATTTRPSNFMPDTNAVMDGVGQNLGDQLRQGRVGAAVGETARGAAAMVPALINDVVLRPLAPVGRGMVDAVSTFAGGDTANPAPAATGPTARLESLRDEYTRATPQRQAEIAKQIREISGTATPEAWKGVELSGGMDSQGYRLPSQLGVVNSATGEVRVPGQGGGQLPPGMTKQVGTSGGKPVYEDASGKRFVGG